jgi:pimeloyl-ACP methyl ester carboxylesterase
MLKIGLYIVGGLLALIVIAIIGAWIALRGPTISYEDMEKRWATPQSKYADLGDIRIHYREDGPKDAPVIFLVHGYGDSHFTWENVAPILSKTYRVISLDLPGHGLTRAPKAYLLQPEAMADLVAAFASKIGVDRFDIAGNSMGGTVSWEVALRHPDRLKHLILIDAGGWPPKAAAPGAKPPLAFQIIASPFGREALKHIDNKPLIRQGVRGEVGNKAPITDAFIDRWAELQRAPFHRDILLNAPLAGFAKATPESIAAIKTPTLILWGDVDPLITKDNADKFHANIAGSKLILYPHIGHLPQVETPEAVARDIAAFIGPVAKP